MKTPAFKFLLLSALSLLFSCKKEKPMTVNYPETKTVDTVDTYFGTRVKDPYRWLENDRSEETENWVKAENKVTDKYLSKIPYRDSLKERITRLLDYEKISAPHREGRYIYFHKNEGLQDQAVVYRYKKDESPADAEVFLDPNSFSEDGTVALGDLSFSENGEILAYSISEGGSDWRKILVMDVESREIIGDSLKNVKFSGISWKANSGFFYSSYDKPDGSELSAKTDQHKLYYHKLGTPQKDDRVIYGGKESEKHRYVSGSLTEDNRFLIISASNSTSGNELYLKDFEKKEAGVTTVLDKDETDTQVLTHKDGELLLMTNRNAPNNKIVKVAAKNPKPENWADLIPEKEQVLDASMGGGFIFAEYMKDAVSKIEQYSTDGQLIREVELPGLGTVSGFGTKSQRDQLFYSFTNYTTPSRIYRYDIQAGGSKLYEKPQIDFESGNYVSEQVFYKSKDGTRIPMMISHKKGLKMNRQNPTLLYGYGGFDISLTPSFSAMDALWMELGGVFAVPNIRGGGEYGKEWHDAGIKMNKQNVFDDFIAAAKYLIDERYTSSNYLAIKGGSNGGLLVGAVMTQEPELMKVALPAVGVMDMLRYHTFTSGAGWAYDYGTAEDSEEMFDYLYKYSPVHNVERRTAYPATLITTGDHDDRVVPAHSFKFAAELQEKQAVNVPVLIRVETDAGHGAGTPVSKTIDQYADIYGFTFWNMGFRELPEK